MMWCYGRAATGSFNLWTRALASSPIILLIQPDLEYGRGAAIDFDQGL